MPKYILDPCVEDELWGIWHFIAQDNPDAATRVIEAAYETFKTLAANPGLGRPRRIRLFTAGDDLNSVAARRGWKLRKMNRWAAMKVNHRYEPR